MGSVWRLFPMSEMCSTTIGHDKIEVSCLDDNGAIRIGSETQANIAAQLKVQPQCIRVVDRIGQHNLEILAEEWKRTVSACESSKSRRVKTPVILSITHPPKSADCFVNGANLCASLRLNIPAIHFSKYLGDIGNYAACGATRIQQPLGVRYSCSDLGLSAVNVYVYGSTIYFRTAPETARGREPLPDVPMQSVTLPCGMEPEFKIHGYQGVNWTADSINP